jgi:hypothetical protein
MKGKTLVLGLLIGCIGGWTAAHQKPRLREEGGAGEVGNIASLETYRAKAEEQKHGAEETPVIEAVELPDDGRMRSARSGVDERVRKTMRESRRSVA